MHSIKQKERNFFDDFSFQEEAEAKAKEYVDLTESYTVLYDLFEKQGVVKSKDVNSYDVDPNKLTFNFVHPSVNLELDTSSYVLYDLVERKQLTYETSTGSFRQDRPRQLSEYKDTVTGQIKSTHSYSYSNIIDLVVVSSSHEKMYQLLQYLETTLIRSKGFLQRHFTSFRCEGIYSNAITPFNNPYGRQVYSKTIRLYVVTEKPFELLHEEIQEIKY